MTNIIPAIRYCILESEVQIYARWLYLSVPDIRKYKAIQVIAIADKIYKIEIPEKITEIKTKIALKENSRPYKIPHTGPMDSSIYSSDLRYSDGLNIKIDASAARQNEIININIYK